MFKDRDLHYSLTTIGTLITREIAGILNEYGVSVLISLDGPEHVHDAFRRLGGDANGSFQKTLRGISHLREAYGQMQNGRLMINAVCGPWTNFEELRPFFEVDPPSAIQDVSYKLSTISHSHVELLCGGSDCAALNDAPHDVAGVAFEKEWFEALIGGEMDKEGKNHRFLRKLFYEGFRRIHNRPEGLLGEHLGAMGMCTPGVRKFYVDIDGNILPCERVSEKFVLGNINENGIDSSRCKALLDEIIDHFEKRCLDCILCRLCCGCIASYCDASGVMTEESIEDYCQRQRASLAKRMVKYSHALDANPDCFHFLEARE